MNSILIVEDSSSFAALLKSRIQAVLAVEVMVARSFKEARALLELSADRFFLGVLDLHLPDAMHGEIVDLFVHFNIPGIVLTGAYKKELQETILHKGMLDYFIKDNPRVVDSVIHAIERVRKNKLVRILVVDDSRAARHAVCRLLGRYGFSILDADGGVAGLQCIAQQKVHLVITDYQMPGMDGLAFVKKLRSDHSREELAVIGLSSLSDAELATRFIKAGANDFLVKPFQPEELLCRVYQNLENIESYQAITRLLDRHQATLIHALDAIITTDSQGRVLEFNPAAEQLFGYSKGVLLGRSIADFIIPEPLRAFHQKGLTTQAARGIHAPRLQRRMEFPGMRADGQNIDLQISLTSLVHEGEVNFTAFLQDVTDKKQLLKSLEETLAVAESASVAKSEFIANMSHEIRTPMNAVLGFAELALKADLPPRVRDYLEKIDNASHSLMGVISDLLDFSKLEAGQMLLDPVPFDLQPLMERLADLFSQQVADKRIELVFLLGNAPDCVLFGDVIRLEQVLINLIRNAVKFTERGTISVVIDAVVLEDGGVRLTCRVRDTGIGVEPTMIPQLFAPFVQADGSTTRKYGGTGLGLTICRRLVTLMGGRMWADSRPGEGSEFAFEVGVGYHGPNRRARPALPEEMWGARVLVVDDNPLVREALCGQLREVLLEPEAVESAEAAMTQLLRANGNGAEGQPYACVLLDWRMPDKDGEVLAVEMRAALDALAPGSVVPRIFLMPPFGLEDLPGRGERFGVDGCLDKPVTRARLVRGLSAAEDGGGGQPERRRARVLGREEETGTRIGAARVLLAVGSGVTLGIARELLERVGLVVDVAREAKEALAMAARYSHHAVLLDWHLPGGEGAGLLARLRETAREREIPVIAMLANEGWDEKKASRDAGARDHVSLPLRAERLYGVLVNRIALRTGEEPEIVEELARVSGLDVVAGLERVGGKETLYRRLLSRFCGEFGGLAEALVGGETELAEAVARVHAVGSAARHLGAITLAEAAGQLEGALQGDDPVERQAALMSFVNRLRVVLRGLRPGIGAEAEKREPVRVIEAPDLGQVTWLLTGLRDRLVHFSIEVEPWLPELEALLVQTGAAFTVRELVKQIGWFHFDEALALVEELRLTFGCDLPQVSVDDRTGQPERILIVDDQPDNVELLKAILSDYRRMVALSGQQALRAVHAGETPDLILLDIMMPEMNGYEVCRRLQEDARTRGIPVIFVSAKKQVTDETEGFALGGVDYITKPFHGEIVKRRVMTHLELKRHRVALEEEVRVRTLELQAAREEAERARDAAESGNRAKSTFLAHMSHEIRTPLNAILGVNELLGETNATPEQRQYLEMSRKASESLLALVNDVLDFSKIEANQFDLERSCFDLHAVVRGAVEILAIQARDRGLRMGCRLAAGLPRHVVGDPNRLRQILLNVMGNAVKFTLVGEVEVRVDPMDGGRIRFAIADTGIGIPEDKLETIFQPFRQADLSTTRQYGGSGLGLSICALLVEHMGGRIHVESTVGKGSVFDFTLVLPAAGPDQELPVVTVVRQSSRERSASDAGERSLSILVAEDSEDNRILLRAFLKSGGHRLDFAENGEVAWEKFRQQRYDIVLMDLQMPILDGYATTRRIRDWELEHGVEPVPVIALTAHAMQEAASDAMEAGCDYYLSKPIAKKRLLEVLREFSSR
ncbi:MAG: response regulator [Magnetococcales bacterium]|nr:response regulator [Magnetococcales bacterium]